MGNSVGEGIWDSHPVVLKDAKKAAKKTANIKETKMAEKNNNVRTKQRMAPPLAKTPAKAPTMRDNSKDSVNKATAKAKANALKAANKPSTSKSADSARAKAAARARLVPPSKRTAAQKMALGRGGMGSGSGARGVFTGSSSGRVGINYNK